MFCWTLLIFLNGYLVFLVFPYFGVWLDVVSVGDDGHLDDGGGLMVCSFGVAVCITGRLELFKLEL